MEDQTTVAGVLALVIPTIAFFLLVLITLHLLKTWRRRKDYLRQLDVPPEPRRGTKSHQAWKEEYEYRDFHHQHKPEQVWEKVKVKGKMGGKKRDDR